MASKYQKLHNKHVLVIGGTSGLGFGVAEASLASGAHVTVSSSNQSRVDSTVQNLKSSFPQATVAGHVCDLSKPTCEKDIEALFEKVGKVDHIVFTGRLETLPGRLVTAFTNCHTYSRRQARHVTHFGDHLREARSGR